MKHKRLTANSVLRREGFSIVEVIVVLAIIGVLTLILVPVVSNRVREARIKAANQDLEHIAAAMERSAIDTNYMYRLYVLDDVIGGDTVSNELPNADTIDGTRDEALNSLHGSRIFIRTDNFVLESAAYSATLYTGQFIVNETKFGWNGPYVNWQRDVNNNDWPDDPWGHDYLLFRGQPPVSGENAGGMGPYENDFVQTGIQYDSSGNTWPAQCDIFDRGVILSVGPDGLPGDGALNSGGDGVYGTGDDLMRKF